MEIRTDTSQWTWYVHCNVFLKIQNHRRPSMNRRPIHGVHGRGMGVPAHSAPIPRLCDGYITPLKWTLRRRFIDVAPMESSKVAYYTPMPRLWFLTGYSLHCPLCCHCYPCCQIRVAPVLDSGCPALRCKVGCHKPSTRHQCHLLFCRDTAISETNRRATQWIYELSALSVTA